MRAECRRERHEMWSRCVLNAMRRAPVARSVNSAVTRMRRVTLPHDREPCRSGVADSASCRHAVSSEPLGVVVDRAPFAAARRVAAGADPAVTLAERVGDRGDLVGERLLHAEERGLLGGEDASDQRLPLVPVVGGCPIGSAAHAAGR